MSDSFLLGVTATSECDITAPQDFRKPPQARELPSCGAGVWPCRCLESRKSQFRIQSVFLERACPVHQSLVQSCLGKKPHFLCLLKLFCRRRGDPGHPQLRHIPSKPATPGSQGEAEGMGQVLGGGGCCMGGPRDLVELAITI